MSGGHFNYEYNIIEDTYCGKMEDHELNDMMKDLVELLRALEWWLSGDDSEVDYRETVAEFKNKWFKGDRNERFKDYLRQEYEQLLWEFDKI